MDELIDIHFNSPLYLSNKILKENYNVYYSDIIDDEYWNLAYLKNNKVNLKEVFNNVKLDMENLNKKPLLYIVSNIIDTNLEKQIESSNLKLEYTDVWLTIDNLNSFEQYKSKVNFLLHKVDSLLMEDFIQTVMNGFSDDNPDDPYESLSDGYKVALKNSFRNFNSNYKVLHYLGRKENENISTATVVYTDKKAIIYNVTTSKNYQRQGVCKQMMSEIINNLIKFGIDTVCLQTEKGFYTEKVYKNMGFKEKLLGKAYIEE